jgi:hypothetical protein
VFLNLVLALEGLILNLSASGLTCDVFRLTTYGPDSPNLVGSGLGGHGALGGAQANAVATAIHFITGDRGRGRQCTMHVPGFPDDFTDDHLTLTSFSRATVTVQARTYIDNVAAAASGTILQTSLVTLHRSAGGIPSGETTVAPVIDASAAPNIARIGRRLYSHR